MLPGNPCPACAIESTATAVSADGTVVVGTSLSPSAPGLDEAVRWTAKTGLVGLGLVPGPGASSSGAKGVSADGTTVVGDSHAPSQAMRWTEASGMVGLGFLPGGVSSRATDVSGDGSVVVGQGDFRKAVRWTPSEGWVAIGSLGGEDFGVATGVSDDGSVVVGIASSPDHDREAFLWTEQDGMTGLGTQASYPLGRSFAEDVSADGKVVVGSTSIDVNPGSGPFRWTAAGGMQYLGTLRGNFGSASAVSADGSTVVGYSGVANGSSAFIWSASHGMRALDEVLTDLGADLTGWRLDTANDVSADGRVIVGDGIAPNGKQQGWIAELRELSACQDGIDNDGDGRIDMADLGCPVPEATLENPLCDDGLDNDGDGAVDFDDAQCQRDWPYWEAKPCGLGAELVIAVPLLAAWRRRGRHALG